MARHPLPFKGLHQALRRADLADFTAEAIFCAIGVALYKAPGSAHVKLIFVNSGSASPPVGYKCRVGEGTID
jgi:hypothetical protein